MIDSLMEQAVNSCSWLWSPLVGGEEAACILDDLGDVAVAYGCACNAAKVRIVCQELSCVL